MPRLDAFFNTLQKRDSMEFFFNLEAALESLDNVPAYFREFFEKKDDGYWVKQVFTETAKAHNAMTTNLKLERDNKTKANTEAAAKRAELNGLKDLMKKAGLEEDKLTAESLKEYISQLSSAAGQSDDLKKALENQKNEMTAHFNTKMQEETSKREQLTKSLENIMVKEAALQAITKQKGSPALLMPIIEKVARVQEEDGKYVVNLLDEKGEIAYDGVGNKLSIETYVTKLKGDKEYAGAFEATVSSGGGTKPDTPSSKQPSGASTPGSKIAAGLAKAKTA